MIVVEGPDSSGKSQLIQLLKDEFGDQIDLSPASRMSGEARNSSSFRDPYSVRNRVYEGIIDAIVGNSKVKIHDRLFFSELVYGNVLRGEICFPWKEQQHICRVLTALSPPIVFCMPPLQAIHAKILGATQMEGATTNIDKIYSTYESMLALQHPRVTKYDYTRGPAARARICRLVAAYLERRAKRKWYPQ